MAVIVYLIIITVGGNQVRAIPFDTLEACEVARVELQRQAKSMMICARKH